MKDYAVDFKNFLHDTKKSSENTLQSYMRDFSQFADFAKENNTKDISKTSTEFINKYIKFLTVCGKSESTISRVISSLRCYFGFLIKIGIINENPILGVKSVKYSKKAPEILTDREVRLLISQPKGKDFKSYRDKAILELLYATGVKVSELVDIKVNDINLTIGFLHLNSDKHERIIPIYSGALKVLSNYIKNVRPSVIYDKNEQHLFTNMSGTPMTRQGLWKIVKGYASKAKISKEITPLTFRHCFAAHLLENGANVDDVQKMLGYSDISSTDVYVQAVKSKYTLDLKKYRSLQIQK